MTVLSILPALFALALAPAAAAAAAAATLPSTAPARLEVEGVGVGDPEGRLVTLMPTARCSDVQGESGIADRWCHIPDQRVFGVLPASLTATLRDDRIDTVIARVPRRVWPLLRANLLERFGAPEHPLLPVLPAALDGSPDGEPAHGFGALRWTRGGLRLDVAPDPHGDAALSLRRAGETGGVDAERAGPAPADPAAGEGAHGQ